MESTLIENLRRLAAKCDLDAAKPNLFQFQRSYLQSLARRYRDAQALELYRINMPAVVNA